MTNQFKSGTGIKLDQDTPTIPFLMFTGDCIFSTGLIKQQREI